MRSRWPRTAAGACCWRHVAVRALTVLAAGALLARPAVTAAQGEDTALTLDLRGALELARRNDPRVEAARHRVAEARGELTGAQVLLPENPELDLAAGPWFNPGPGVAPSLAADAALSQRLELAGQRSHRVDRARAGVEAAEGDVEAALRALDLAVASAVLQALAGKETVAIAEENERLARDLLDIARRRLEAGAGTPLEVNGARIRLAEAARGGERARAERDQAIERLRPLLGAPPVSRLEIVGALPSAAAPLVADATTAFDRRAEIAAARRRVQAAEAESRLASAQAAPDVRVGARYTLEEGSNAFFATLALPLPLFQRNQGERERARAAVERLRADERAVAAEVSAEVAQAAREDERARRAVALYDQAVLRALEENLSLLGRMFEAGKVSPAEVLLLQRELQDGRLGFVQARAELALAEARLRTALGLPILDLVSGGTP